MPPKQKKGLSPTQLILDWTRAKLRKRVAVESPSPTRKSGLKSPRLSAVVTSHSHPPIQGGGEENTPVLSKVTTSTIPPNLSIVPEIGGLSVGAEDPAPPSQLTDLPADEMGVPQIPMVKTKRYIYDSIWPKFEKLYGENPNHPIFGPATKGVLRLPMYKSKGQFQNAACWELKIENFARVIESNMGKDMPAFSCWMGRNEKGNVTREEFPYDDDGEPILNAKGQHKKKNVHCTEWRWVRLLAFINEPSDDNWDRLTNAKDTFDHFCGNGAASHENDAALYCLNGIQHGGFASLTDNMSRKSCAGGCLALCPGHGPKNQGCLWVDKDTGHLKPCLNSPFGLPPCSHPRVCWVSRKDRLEMAEGKGKAVVR